MRTVTANAQQTTEEETSYTTTSKTYLAAPASSASASPVVDAEGDGFTCHSYTLILSHHKYCVSVKKQQIALVGLTFFRLFVVTMDF